MKKIVALSLGLYLFVLAWTSAFALDPRLPIHVIIALTSAILFMVYVLFGRKGKVSINVLRWEDTFVVAIVGGLIVSSLLNPTSSSINYISAYIYVFLIAYCFLKIALHNCLEIGTAKKWLLWGVVFASLVSVLEFYSQYLFGINPDLYLKRIREIPIWFGGVYPRSASLSTEPGVFAFYMSTVGLIAIGLLYRSKKSYLLRAVILATILLGWAFTFSAAGLAAILVGICVSLCIRLFDSNDLLKKILPIYVLPIALISFLALINYIGGTAMGQIATKLTLDGGASATVRLSEWNSAIETIGNKPVFGVGPGTASAAGESSHLSWYLFLGAEGGFISLFPVLLFIIVKFCRMVISSVSLKYWYIAGFIAGAIHLSVISTFFHPFLWALIMIFDLDQTHIYKNAK